MDKYYKFYYNTMGFLMEQKEVTQQDEFTNILIFEAMDVLNGVISNYERAVDEIIDIYRNEQDDCNFENLCWAYVDYYNTLEGRKFRDCWRDYYNEC